MLEKARNQRAAEEKRGDSISRTPYLSAHVKGHGVCISTRRVIQTQRADAPQTMAVLLEYKWRVVTRTGGTFAVRACGAPADDGTRRWHGWLEFMPGGDHAPLRTPRETTQPSRAATLYWAEGITPVYLEGALRRAGPLIASHDRHREPRLSLTRFRRFRQWLGSVEKPHG